MSEIDALDRAAIGPAFVSCFFACVLLYFFLIIFFLLPFFLFSSFVSLFLSFFLLFFLSVFLSFCLSVILSFFLSFVLFLKLVLLQPKETLRDEGFFNLWELNQHNKTVVHKFEQFLDQILQLIILMTQLLEHNYWNILQDCKGNNKKYGGWFSFCTKVHGLKWVSG